MEMVQAMQTPTKAAMDGIPPETQILTMVPTHQIVLMIHRTVNTKFCLVAWLLNLDGMPLGNNALHFKHSATLTSNKNEITRENTVPAHVASVTAQKRAMSCHALGFLEYLSTSTMYSL